MNSIWMTLTKGFSGFTNAQSNKKVSQTKVIMTINAPIDRAFNYIVPVDLSRIFKRYKKLPAIIKTNETERWIKTGLIRTIYFEDGSTSQESLLTVVPHTSFSYRIENFTSQLRFLAKRIEGEWLFIESGKRHTKIEWTYKVIPKNIITQFIINKVLIKDLKGLLNNALAILKDDLEVTNTKMSIASDLENFSFQKTTLKHKI